MPSEALDVERVNDREFILKAICDSKPFVTPGTMLAYHAASGGFILGEIVSRVTGKIVRDVLAEEILRPLKFRWGNWGVAEEDIDKVGRDYVTGARLFPPLSMAVKRVLSMPVEKVVELAHDPRVLTAVIESANVVTTANELSRFFEIFRAGGEMDGLRIMQRDTIHRALTEQSRLEIDLSLGFPTRFSYGLMLGSRFLSPFGLDTDQAFGHLGLINIMGWGDPERAISVGLITSGKALLYPEVPRFWWVMQTISSTMPKVPQSQRLI
jgi:CubicO group peptidase (beta-lactamase class C family)